VSPTLNFDVPYPDRSSRLLALVRFLLVIPNAVALLFVAVLMYLVNGIAWLVIIITGKHPRGLWDFTLMTLRWAANLTCYSNYLRDEYPPFGGGAYPVVFELDYPERVSRLRTFFRPLLALPNSFVFGFVSFVATFAVTAAWLVILITGRYPRGLFDFVVGATRWQFRLAIYQHHMTDAYPPFSLE